MAEIAFLPLAPGGGGLRVGNSEILVEVGDQAMLEIVFVEFASDGRGHPSHEVELRCFV